VGTAANGVQESLPFLLSMIDELGVFRRRSGFAFLSMKPSISERTPEPRFWRNTLTECPSTLPERLRDSSAFLSRRGSVQTNNADCTRNWLRRWWQFIDRPVAAVGLSKEDHKPENGRD